MQRAYLAAARACGNSDPNPAVGALLVNAEGAVLAEGSTRRAGFQHAERDLLEQLAGADLSLCTLYVTLEPCCHHGRTPPCTDAIIAAGVRRVIIAERDFGAEVMGQSMQILHDVGVDVGLLESSAMSSERWFTSGPFFHSRKYSRPRVILKWAQTADGALAPSTGPSGAISGFAASVITATLRSCLKYTLASAGTAVVDQPKLTVRFPENLNGFKPDGLSDFFQALIRAQMQHSIDDGTRYKPNANGYMRRGENFDERTKEIHEAGFNSLLLEAGPTYSEKILTDAKADALVIYRSKNKTSEALWGNPGRGNTVSRQFLAETNTIAGFHLLEFADLGEDEFFLFARDE